MKNRHGCTLVIQNDGVVKGERNEENEEMSSSSQGTAANKYAILEFIPTEPPGAFRIRGIVADLYLAMDSKGRLYGESDRTDGATIFAEHSQVVIIVRRYYLCRLYSSITSNMTSMFLKYLNQKA